MLSCLRVRHLAIIDELEVELGPGLNVITGETGAGKSILIDALTLVLGGKGRAELVRVHLRLELRDGAIQLLARSTGGQGSARSSSMAWAHGLVLLSADGEGAPAGSVVSVQVFDGSFAASAEPGYRWS